MYYSEHIRPHGIFRAVSLQQPLVHARSANSEIGRGTRWHLALQIDPEACCWIDGDQFDLDQTLIRLMANSADLDAFLQRFPTVGCPAKIDHRLNLFANHNRVISHAIRHYRNGPVVEMLITASWKNARYEDAESYHRSGQTLLIVYSPVQIETVTDDGLHTVDLEPIHYRDLAVTGINLQEDRILTPDQILSACESCPTLVGSIWRKQYRCLPY